MLVIWFVFLLCFQTKCQSNKIAIMACSVDLFMSIWRIKVKSLLPNGKNELRADSNQIESARSSSVYLKLGYEYISSINDLYFCIITTRRIFRVLVSSPDSMLNPFLIKQNLFIIS